MKYGLHAKLLIIVNSELSFTILQSTVNDTVLWRIMTKSVEGKHYNNMIASYKIQSSRKYGASFF